MERVGGIEPPSSAWKFRRHGCSPTNLLRELPGIETDFAAEIAGVIDPTDARLSTLQMLGIKHGPGSPISEVGRQRGLAIDELFTIWVEVHRNEPSVHPTAGGSTPFVELLRDTFRALGRLPWVRGAESAAKRVKRERGAGRNATAT